MIIYDSLYEAVKGLIQDTYLGNSEYQYIPLSELSSLPKDAAWPRLTVDAKTAYVNGYRVRIDLEIAILFKPQKIDYPPTKLELEARANKEMESHILTLIEIYHWLTGRLRTSSNEYYRDYNTDGDARIRRFSGVQGLDKDQADFFTDVDIVAITIPLLDSYNKICPTCKRVKL